MRIGIGQLGAAPTTQDYIRYCGHSCEGFGGLIDPCCYLMDIPVADQIIDQHVGAVMNPGPAKYPAPGQAPPVGTPVNYDPTTGQCVGACGNPTYPSQDQQYQASIAPILGTSCDPDSNAFCRWFALGCQNKNAADCKPAVPFWIPLTVLGVVAFFMLRRS